MSGFPPALLQQAQAFVKALQANPALYYVPELAFFKEYLESLGATIPPKPEPKAEPKQKPAETKPEPKAAEPEPVEEEIEEEFKGEADPDLWVAEEPFDHEMGNPNKEVSDEENGQAMSLFSEARGLLNNDLDGAILKLTEAIKLSPKAVFFATRGEAYFKQKKPNAAIKDCTQALALNPDQTKAYKVRGKAKRFLGQYEEGILDLFTGQKLDFDEDTQNIINNIKARVEAIQAFKRDQEKKRQEKELAARKKRVAEARARAQAEEEERRRRAEAEDEEEEMGGGPGMGGLPPEFMDPEVMGILNDPTMLNKIREALTDPTKHKDDPKVQSLLKKIGPLFAKMGMGGGVPGSGAGGFPGGGFPGAGGFGADPDLDVD